MDTDHDAAVSAAEYAAAESRLLGLGEKLIEIESEDQSLLPQSIEIEFDESDALHFRVNFPATAGREFRVKSAIINQLSRGHRQYLVVKDQQGTVLADSLLTARNPWSLVSSGPSSLFQILSHYVVEGIWHIFIGLDHILFLLTLMLPAVLVYRQRRWRSVDKLRPAIIEILKIVTAFSLAHSLTLSLAVLEVVTLPARWIESAIAISVLLAALNNLYPLFPGSRWRLAFGFGLVHGFGFANVLLNLELSPTTLALSLVGFNLGVELGQVAIVVLVFPLAYVLRDTRLYRGWVLQGGSLGAATLACVWLLERSFGYHL
jgi:hypothetical protein